VSESLDTGETPVPRSDPLSGVRPETRNLHRNSGYNRGIWDDAFVNAGFSRQLSTGMNLQLARGVFDCSSRSEALGTATAQLALAAAESKTPCLPRRQATGDNQENNEIWITLLGYDIRSVHKILAVQLARRHEEFFQNRD